MEMSQFFAYLVLGICATHLVWTAGTQITTWWNVRKNNNRSENTALHAKPIQQRSDWYVFFRCSDLVGPDPVSKKIAPPSENRAQKPQKNPRPQIRPTAH